MPPAVFHYMLRTVEVVLFASRAGEERRNVIHYRYADGSARPTVTELTNLLNDVELNIIDKQEDVTCLGTVWYQITARDMEDVGGAQVARAVTRSGTGGTNVLPGASAFCLSKRTGQPGKSFRGRFYLFDLDESASNGDDLNPAFNFAFTQLANELLLARQAGRFLPSVGSRLLGGSTPILAITWDQVFDTQVRRGKNRGR